VTNVLLPVVPQDVRALHLLPAPPQAPSFSLVPWARLKIVTGGDEASVAAARKVIANQKMFARMHGYRHEVHVGNYAQPWIAYWHKIEVLLKELQAPHSPEVQVWMDLDMLVTNPRQKMLESVLEAHPQKAVLLTEDAHRGNFLPGHGRTLRRVNTGVILVRSGPRAVRVLERLFEFGRQHRDAAYLPQKMDTLHEQDAFNWMLGGPRRHVWGRHIAVIPQRSGALNLNTFARNLYDASFQDPSASEWTVGDFTAHCTGLRSQLREWCLDDSFAAAEEIVAKDAVAACSNTTMQALGES